MDIHRSIHAYVERMITEVDGMKVLLVDMDTSYLLEHQVFLVNLLDSRDMHDREPLRHLKCLCLLRPTAHNIDLLCKELASPFFLKNAFTERLAEADEFELVKQVTEYYADCVALTPNSFTLNTEEVIGEQLGAWNPKALLRCVDGLAGALLALKRRPIIRYVRSSSMAAALANELRTVIMDTHRQQFDFRKTDNPPILLILDRRHDLASALLLQWTFQAMLHELLTPDGIRNNRIKFTGDGGKLVEMALSIDQDAFYRDNMYSNYGQLGDNVQKLVKQYEKKAREHANADPSSLSDMKRFIEEYPEWRKQGETVGKHVALASILQRIVSEQDLLNQGEVEQSMIMQGSEAALHTLSQSIGKVHGEHNRLRLALLYTVHYCNQTGFNIVSLMDLMKRHSLDVTLIDFAVRYATGDNALIGHGNALPTPLQSPPIDNTVYTQHISPAVYAIDKLVRGKLPLTDYPQIDTWNMEVFGDAKPTDIIVFAVNGGAFQEQCQLQRHIAHNYPHIRIVYGCNAFLNSNQLVQEMQRIKNHLSECI